MVVLPPLCVCCGGLRARNPQKTQINGIFRLCWRQQVRALSAGVLLKKGGFRQAGFVLSPCRAVEQGENAAVCAAAGEAAAHLEPGW